MKEKSYVEVVWRTCAEDAMWIFCSSTRGIKSNLIYGADLGLMVSFCCFVSY